MLQKGTALKSINKPGGQPRWHPDITGAAEQGGAERIAQARAARQIVCGCIRLEPDASHWPLRHSSRTAPQNPFPADFPFGILPYAVWHGHHEVVADFIQRGAHLETKQG